MGIAAVPDDVLVRIFKYLPAKDRLRIERVCRKWKEIAPNAWSSCKSIRFEELCQTSKDYSLVGITLKQLMMRAGIHLKILIANQCVRYPMESLTDIGQVCRNVQVIHLRWPVFTFSSPNLTAAAQNDHIERFFLCFENLEELSLVYPYLEMPSGVTINFISRLHHLARLELIGAELVTETFPNVLGALSNTLRCLVLGETFPRLSEASLISGVSRLANLRELTLLFVRLEQSSEYLSENAIMAISQGCKQMEFLFISWVTLTPKGLLSLAKHPRLETLVLLNCFARPSLWALKQRPGELTHRLNLYVRDRDDSDISVDLSAQRITVHELPRFLVFVDMARNSNSSLRQQYWNIRMFGDFVAYNPERPV